MRHAFFAGWAAMCLLATTWPGYAWVAGRAPHLVGGLPFALVWNLAWLVAMFIAMVAYHRTGRAR